MKNANDEMLSELMDYYMSSIAADADDLEDFDDDIFT